jgi:hypothetical protein
MDASLCRGKISANQGAWAMPFNAPFKLGPFTVDPEGRLSPWECQTTPAFLFRWRGRLVRTRLIQHDPATDRLVLVAEVAVGRVPSTAGFGDEMRRPRSFALVHWLTRVMPAGWRVGLAPDHRVWLEAKMPLGVPATAVGLLTMVTCFVLDLAPYLELLDETGVSV